VSGADRTLLAVLDYGIGNLRSAQKSLERQGAEAHLTADRGLIRAAAGVVLPGVGHFGSCMAALRERGLEDIAVEAAASGRPFLGICVGAQMLYERSEEAPGIAGLGILQGWIRRLPAGVKHPQMQWNRLDLVRPHPLTDGLGDRPWMYFVHSFAPDDPDHAIATCDYGGPVVAAVARTTLWATQFHPEKSGVAGLALLGNFVAACRDGASATATAADAVPHAAAPVAPSSAGAPR
jgi:glutamine amidotransferase